ncbi:hypothetical protein LCGC14_2174220 [marine sediment metagenome]|uniref:Uncharacterized protein n=1 Tax=marine sediment metagenome TaxID=412755 RepID=A0A0F9EBD2_9ZZZZ
MALRWIEGFEGFGGLSGAPLIAEVAKKYDASSVSGVTLEDGRGSGNSLNIGTTNAQFISKTFDDQTTWVIGFAFHTPSAFTGVGRVMVNILEDAAPQMVLKLTNDDLEVFRNASLLQTITLSLSTSTWYYIEFKVTIHDSAGAWEVRVNGSTVDSDSGIDTSDNGNPVGNTVKIHSIVDFPWYDDIYILDGTGSVNNNFLGEMKVEILLPNSDSISSDWLLSAGSDHYALVDDNPSDEDTTYVYSSTSDDVDYYNYEDIGSELQTIYGVQINTQARVLAASMDMYLTVSSNSSVSNGTAVTVSDTNYKTFARPIELDPDTSALWLSGGIDDALFGVKFV